MLAVGNVEAQPEDWSADLPLVSFSQSYDIFNTPNCQSLRYEAQRLSDELILLLFVDELKKADWMVNNEDEFEDPSSAFFPSRLTASKDDRFVCVQVDEKSEGFYSVLVTLCSSGPCDKAFVQDADAYALQQNIVVAYTELESYKHLAEAQCDCTDESNRSETYLRSANTAYDKSSGRSGSSGSHSRLVTTQERNNLGGFLASLSSSTTSWGSSSSSKPCRDYEKNVREYCITYVIRRSLLRYHTPGVMEYEDLCQALVNLREPRLLEDKEIEGLLCSGLDGKGPDCLPLRFWVGKEDFLVRYVEVEGQLFGRKCIGKVTLKPEKNPYVSSGELNQTGSGLGLF